MPWPAAWPATDIVASAIAVAEAEPEGSPLPGSPVLMLAGKRMAPECEGQLGGFPLPPESTGPGSSRSGAERAKAQGPRPGSPSECREEKIALGTGAETYP